MTAMASTMMLAPDLLDRRALALLALVDAFGRPFEGSVAVESEGEGVGGGVRSIAKRGGRLAIIEAAGFAEYVAAFPDAPARPKAGSRSLVLDLTPSDRAVLPRRVTIKLPRDADPAKRADPASLFQPHAVALAAAPCVRPHGNACILRVTVTRAGDGARIENALVRARSDDGTSGSTTVWGLTDAGGETALVFAALPITFVGAGGAIAADTGCAVIVHADPASARFTDPLDLPEARRAAAVRRQGHVDPDAMSAAHPADFAGAATVRIAAGAQPALALAWTAP